MPISRRPKAVKDGKQGTAKVTIDVSPENELDYEVLDLWSPDSTDDEEGDPLADVKFIDGKSLWLPIYLYENELPESKQTIKWEVTESGYGFKQKSYSFNESDDVVFVEVSPQSTNKKVTITINDNDQSKTTTGDAADNNISGSNSNDKLYGENGNDTLKGGSGNDTLNGSSGNDVMQGGKGNDNYVVDSTGDIVTEYPNEGIDTVKSSVNFTLGDKLDNLILTGFDNIINGTGNTLNNKILGNVADNYLFGGDGNDTLWGDYTFNPNYGGNDILDGGKGNDSLYGGFADDTLWGDFGKDYLNGGDGDDVLSGEADNDLLDGWNGNDTLSGGTGNDTLVGDFGNDNLDGGDGKDALYGEDGTDRLNGYGTVITTNAQFDTLTGGVGTDYFILGGSWGVSYIDNGSGYAIITDWNPSSDWIEVKGNASQYTLKLENKAGSSALDTAIYYGTNELIGVVQDIANVSIAQNFIFV